MSEKYGFTKAEWKKAKDEVRNILIRRAKVRGMIPYSELVADVKTINLKPESYALAEMLGEVSTAEDEAGRGLLSVIVVHKYGDMQPGSGFFEMARSRGRDTSDILKCWIEEVKRVHAQWSINS